MTAKKAGSKRKGTSQRATASRQRASKGKRPPAERRGFEAIDQIVGSLLKRPVEVRWEGSLADAFRGHFRGARISVDEIVTAWLPLERATLSAREARIVAGAPGRLEVREPAVEIAVSQADLDGWMERFELPFSLHLEETGLRMKAEVAGFPVGEFQARLEIVRGWFVLRPRRAALLGVPQYVSSLFRTYLPVPPISDQTKLAGIEHEAGRLRLRFSVDDFEEELTPGLVDRLRSRVMPFAR